MCNPLMKILPFPISNNFCPLIYISVLPSPDARSYHVIPSVTWIVRTCTDESKLNVLCRCRRYSHRRHDIFW